MFSSSHSPVRIGKNNISCGLRLTLMVTGAPEGFHLLLNLLNIWLLQAVFIFSYLSASLYPILQLLLELFHALFFLLWLEEADGRSWQGFSLWVPSVEMFAKMFARLSHEQPVFPASIFRNISNILRTWPDHLLPTIIWEMQIRWKYFLNQISIFYLFAWPCLFKIDVMYFCSFH